MKNYTQEQSTNSKPSYTKQLNQLEQANTQLRDKLAQQQHNMKKELLVLETELNFERKKAEQFENKWKESITVTDQHHPLKALCTQLTNDLNSKEHDLTELKKKEFERKRKISQLEEELKKLKDNDTMSKGLIQDNKNLRGDIEKIKETAVRALMDKDAVISDLEDRLKIFEEGQYKNGDITYELTHYKQKYQELEEKYERAAKDRDQQSYQNRTEISELKQRLEAMKIRTEERSAILEQDIVEYEKYIEELKREKSEETILTKSLDELQDKYRKAEKKVYDLETELEDSKAQKVNESKKMETEIHSLRLKVESLKTFQTNYSTIEKQSQKIKKTLQKQIEDLKYQVQKLNQVNKQSISKVLQLQAQKNRLAEDLDEYRKQNSHTLAQNQQLKEHFSELMQKHAELQNWSPEKQQSTLSEELGSMEAQQFHLKKDHSAVDDRLKELEEELDEKIAENEQLRNKVLQLSEVKITDESKNIIVQLEDYRQHINKLENNILIIKLRYAEDESFWKERQKTERIEFAEKTKKLIKEKGELYEKLDKLRKTKGERRNFYVSALK